MKHDEWEKIQIKIGWWHFSQRRQQLFHQIPKFMLHQFRTESTIENLFCLLLRIQWSNLISHLSGSWTFALPPCSKLQNIFFREIENITLILVLYLRKNFVKLTIFFLFLFLDKRMWSSLTFVNTCVQLFFDRSSQICWMSSLEKMTMNSILNFIIRKFSFNFHKICLFSKLRLGEQAGAIGRERASRKS